MYQKLGNRLREVRMRKGLSQQELAAELCLSKRTIGSYEKGCTVPPANIMYELCMTLEVKADYLFGFDNRKWICIDFLNQFEIELVAQIVISLRCSNETTDELT